MITTSSSILSSELKKKLVSQAIKDPLFKTALREASAEIVKISTSGANEATIEGAFERILYGVLKDIGVSFHPDKETPVKTRRHTARGRTDSRIGALVIEYKQPSTLASETDVKKATSQLTEYLSAISDDLENEVVGFLTDGTKILELRVQEGVVFPSAFSPLEEGALSRLIRSIISLKQSALSAPNLIRDFCGNAYDGIVFQVARNLNEILAYGATTKTEMLRTEWEALFRLAHEDQSLQKRIQDRRKILGEIFEVSISEATMEYRALFALHTAYAIILKLIAYRVVSDVKFKTVLQDYKSLTMASSDVMRAFCATLEDGELFRQIGILNLLEGDFFSWYSAEEQWNEKISQGIKNILITLARYEDVKSIFDKSKAVDLFRSLYEATVPQVVRASFGEFYTPYWLAEQVLKTSQPKQGWNALDPCCGSGTFLIAAISKMRAEMIGKDPHEIAKSVFSRIFGIDLNPLAILTSRIHYFVHIADLLEDFEEQIVIPVFLGDASNVPMLRKEDGVQYLYYELRTLKTPLNFQIPLKIAQNYKRFTGVMYKFENLVKAKAYEAAKSYLLQEAKIAKLPESANNHLGALADQLIELERKDWNGIWARIIANFITTACIGSFTNIIGNPPWIDWKSLPAGYRDKVKAFAIDRGLFSGAGRTGGINLNICALIAHVSAANWLAKRGCLAFLMPKELINQPSYEGWRAAIGGTDCSLVEFHDWSNAGHPFDPVKEDFLTFVFRRETKSQTELPIFEYNRTSSRAKAHLWGDLAEANKHLDKENKVAGQIIPHSTAYTIAEDSEELEKFRRIAGSCQYIGREGIEFYPQELLLFHYVGDGPKPGTVWVRNIQVRKSKYKIPAHQFLLETKFLFPLAKGPYIGVLEYNDPDILVAFPYDADTPHAPIEKSVLKKSSPFLFQYYEKFKKIFDQQTAYSDSIRGAGEYYGLARTGPYSFKSCYVVFRDNTKWCATVLTTKTMPWGEEKRYLFQNHAVSMCERADGKEITEEEAYFVGGIFNTKVVAHFIYASSDNRSFKIRPPVFVPLFDPLNTRHAKIVSLAREAANNPDKRADLLKQLEYQYIALCEKR